MSNLSIVIPTFNRNDLLNKTIESLLAASVESFPATIDIFDNKSPRPVVETVPAEWQRRLGNKLRIHTNAHNVGLCANIMRAVEAARGEWVWILSDDDPPIATCFESIFARMYSATADTVAINFAPPGVNRTEVRNTKGLADFCAIAKPIWPYGIISSTIYRMGSISCFLDSGYKGAFAIYPHLAMLFRCLDQGGGVMHVPDQIMSFTEDASFSWSRFELDLGAPTLAEPPLTWENRRTLYRYLRDTTPGPRSFAGLLEKHFPDLAERCVLMNQFMHRRFADQPLNAAALSLLMMLYVVLNGFRRKV